MGGFGGFGGGAGGGSAPSFDFGALARNLSPQAIVYAIPLVVMALQAVSSLASLAWRYWYVLLIMPLVPAQHRRNAMMAAFLWSVFGGGGYY
jgi:hypothetical protein